MKATIRAFALGAWLAGAGAAHAAPIFTLAGGAPTTELANDFLWVVGPVIEGATLGISEPGFLIVEYIGKEAGFAATEFWLDGLLVTTTNSGLPVREGQTGPSPFPPPGIARGLAPYVTAIDAGVLIFSFRIPGGGGTVVANGDPPGPDGAASIGLWWSSAPTPIGATVYALLDDGGGFNPGEPSDQDHDDMIVRLTVTSVIPEPATWGMVGAGVAFLAFLRRRPQRSRAAR